MVNPTDLFTLTEEELLQLSNDLYAELIRRTPNTRANLTITAALNVLRGHMGDLFSAYESHHQVGNIPSPQ